MQPGSNLKAEGTHSLPNGNRASNGAARAVERGESSIPGALDLPATESIELAQDKAIVRVDQLLPAPVPYFCGFGGGADDIGEHHGGENTLGARHRPVAGEEGLHLGENGVGVANSRGVIPTG
jgi:hypothetical protein